MTLGLAGPHTFALVERLPQILNLGIPLAIGADPDWRRCL